MITTPLPPAPDVVELSEKPPAPPPPNNEKEKKNK